jgi:cytochrome c551/c552
MGIFILAEYCFKTIMDQGLNTQWQPGSNLFKTVTCSSKHQYRAGDVGRSFQKQFMNRQG